MEKPSLLCWLLGHKKSPEGFMSEGVHIEYWKCERCGRCTEPTKWVPGVQPTEVDGLE